MGVGMAERRLNAPGIVPALLSHAEKPSSYPHPIPTSRLSPSRYLSHTTFTFSLPTYVLSYAQESAGKGGW